MYPRLTPRLRTVAELVPAGARLADVGTDHAFLPAHLLAAGRVSAAIGTDIRPGPLARARETAERCGLEELLSLRLCNGLSGISAEEVDAIVIAGMGGETILDILEAEPWSFQKVCILQPMSAVELLRTGLDRLGVPIAKEVLVREGDTLYLVFYLTGKATEACASLTPAERYVGTAAAHDGDPLWPEYLARSRRRAARALEGLARSQKPEDQARAAYFRQVADGLEEMWKAGKYHEADGNL